MVSALVFISDIQLNLNSRSQFNILFFLFLFGVYKFFQFMSLILGRISGLVHSRDGRCSFSLFICRSRFGWCRDLKRIYSRFSRSFSRNKYRWLMELMGFGKCSLWKNWLSSSIISPLIHIFFASDFWAYWSLDIDAGLVIKLDILLVKAYIFDASGWLCWKEEEKK